MATPGSARPSPDSSLLLHFTPKLIAGGSIENDRLRENIGSERGWIAGAMIMKILFLHGWNSVPGGLKPTYLSGHGHEVLNPALPDDDFAEALRIAQSEFDRHQPQVVVGSSRGGAVAMNMSSGNAKLVLLCPAWKKFGTARAVRPRVAILHSRCR